MGMRFRKSKKIAPGVRVNLNAKSASISIGPKDQSFCPRRDPAHLLAENVQAHSGICFDDDLIMHMCHDAAAAESFHGMHQDVSGCSLHNVLDKLRSVTLDSLPLLCTAHAFISDRLPAEPVHAEPWFHIGKHPAGWQRVR